MLNPMRDKNEGTCDHGLSRRSLRVKPLRVELESKSKRLEYYILVPGISMLLSPTNKNSQPGLRNQIALLPSGRGVCSSPSGWMPKY